MNMFSHFYRYTYNAPLIALSLLLFASQVVANIGGPPNFKATIESIDRFGFVRFENQQGYFRLYGISQVATGVETEAMHRKEVICTPLRRDIWTLLYTRVYCRIEGQGDIGQYLFDEGLVVTMCPDARLYGYCGYQSKPFD